tara:strand:- start:56740 stop:56967 length:228 start_codon:yes stop_codon:yes gene_type:complete
LTKKLSFAGSYEGEKRAAIIYSINPRNYLNDILARLPTTLIKDIKQLYPYNWVPQNYSGLNGPRNVVLSFMVAVI